MPCVRTLQLEKCAVLVQNILYRGDNGGAERKSKAIARFEGEKIPGGRQNAWNNQPLLIPPVPPSTETHPVSVSYQVKFDVRVPWGSHFLCQLAE